MPWLDEARRPVGEVAEALGLDGDPRRGFACPACREERRDRTRFAIGLRRDGAGWRCHRCGEGGDAIDLVAWHLGGARFRDLGAEDRGRVRAWFGTATSDVPVPRLSSPAVVAVASRPPREEVDALWSTSLPLVSCLPGGSAPDARAARFLRGRGLLDLADAIADADLARLTPLPGGMACPTWWPAGRLALWRLVVRAWHVGGEPVSLHARAVEDRPTTRDGEPMPKQLWPGSRNGSRYDAGGLFFADPPAARLLRGDGAGIGRVLICEGLTDWLSAAAWCRRNALADVAVLGGVSGSFPALAQVRWPDQPVDIVVAVDHDAAGDRYVEQIRAALPGRSLRRLHLAGAA